MQTIVTVERVDPATSNALDMRVRFCGFHLLDFELAGAFTAYYGDGHAGIIRGTFELMTFVYHFEDLPDKSTLFLLMGWTNNLERYGQVLSLSKAFRALASSEYNRHRAAGGGLSFDDFLRVNVKVTALCADYSKTAQKL